MLTGVWVARMNSITERWVRTLRGELLDRALLARREVPTVPAPVVAQSWSGSARQVQLARLLAGCDVEALDDGQARSVGAIAARAATTDIVDACVIEGAVRRGDLVVTSDPDDLQSIASAVGHQIEIDHP